MAELMVSQGLRLAFAYGLALTPSAMPPVGQSTEPTKPAPDPTVVEKGLGEELDAYMSALAALGFNGSVLVAKEGKRILCKGYGLADREDKLPNRPDTLFDIGSLTKQFTAAAILKLEEQDKLKLSDRLSKHVGEVPEDKAAITLHHLLTHTSGLPREVPISSATTERDALVDAALSTPLRSKPGDEFCYTNAGYDLLAAVVEIATGKRFEEYATEQLFRPAGLEQTRFLQDPAIDPASTASGYEGSTRIGPAQEGWYSWGLRGAGGILSNVLELERWWGALDGDLVLSAPSRKKLFAPNRLDYACGWWVRDQGDLGRVIEHSGTTRGFESSFACYPERHLLVIVLSNERQTCKPAAFSLARAAAGLPYTKLPAAVALDPAELRLCEGTYVAGQSAEIEVRAVGARLALELSPKAVVLLVTGREAKSLSRNPKLAEKIAEILLLMRSGDASGLSALVSTKYPGWNRTLVGVWRGWCEERGSYVRHEVLGFDRAGEGERAFVAVEHADGARLVEMFFEEGRWSGFEIDGGLPSGPAFLPRSSNEFAWLDPTRFGSRTCELLFERDAKGLATMLTVRAGSSSAILGKRKR